MCRYGVLRRIPTASLAWCANGERARALRGGGEIKGHIGAMLGDLGVKFQRPM